MPGFPEEGWFSRRLLCCTVPLTQAPPAFAPACMTKGVCMCVYACIAYVAYVAYVCTCVYVHIGMCV